MVGSLETRKIDQTKPHGDDAMARKTKDSRRVEAKKKRRLKRLRGKSEAGFYGGESDSLGPLGLEKMSEVLGDFVEPFVGQTRNIDEYRNLFHFGVMAWNTALLPEDERQEAIDDIIRKIGPETGAELRELQVLLDQLILRKKRHFATNRRVIAGFDLRETSEGFCLNVVSSLDAPAGLP